MKDPNSPDADQPPVTEEALNAWADDRLDATQRARLDAWLSEQPEQAARAADWQQQRKALHDAFDEVLDEPVPARLSALLRPAPRRWPMALAAGFACAMLGGLTGWELGLRQVPATPLPPGPMATLSRQAAVAHAVYVPEVRHPVEVAANEEAHLVTWLSRRLSAPLKVPDLNAQGYQLVGGRLLPASDGPGAQLMYERADGLRLTLYLSSKPAESDATAFRYAREGAISVFYWVEAPFAYALSAELGRNELLSLARSAHQQLQH